MANISGSALLSSEDLYTINTTIPSGYYLGQYVEGNDGKGFRFAKVGASTLVVGNLLQSSAVDTQFTNMAVPANAVGSTAVTVTNGTTTVAANDFDGGSLSIYTAPGLGEEYTILGHSTGTSGASLTLYLDRGLRTAWNTSTKVNMRRSPWSGVVQGVGTTLTGTAVGVALVAGTIGTFCWVQTHGVGPALSDASSILVGSAVMPSSSVAGAVGLATAGFPIVGQAMQAAATGHTIAVQLTID